MFATRVRPLDLPEPRGWRLRRARFEGRTIAVGDVHGRWDLLKALIAALEGVLAGMPSEPTRLIILGDFIDRGPDSREIVEFLRAAQRRNGGVIVLQGNHEAALLAAVAGDANAQAMWLAHGGAATLESFGIAPYADGEDPYDFGARVAAGIGSDVLDWLADLPLSVRFSRYFFCHAGVRPRRPLDRQSAEDLLWIRREFIDDDSDHGAVVVHGHTISADVDVRANRIGIDTGAHASDVLSSIVLGQHEQWIVSTVPDDGADGAHANDGAALPSQ